MLIRSGSYRRYEGVAHYYPDLVVTGHLIKVYKNQNDHNPLNQTLINK